MPKPLPDDVRQALAAGHQIEAIRLLRGHTGLGLAQAKAAVDAGLVPDDAPLATNFASMPAEVAALVAAGDKLEAIRRLRTAQGLSLKDARDRVEAASRQAAARAGRQAAGLSPGEVPRMRWSPAAVGIVLLLLAAVAGLLFVRG